MSCGVRPDLLNGSALVDGAVAIDNEVIADVAPTVTLDVPLADLLNGKILALRRSRAMDDDLVNFSHYVCIYSDSQCQIMRLQKSGFRQRR